MRPINTSPELSQQAKDHLMSLLQEKGRVRIGCGAPATGFAQYAEACGVPVDMVEEGGMLVISRREGGQP
jgi:hypothetical protein